MSRYRGDSQGVSRPVKTNFLTSYRAITLTPQGYATVIRNGENNSDRSSKIGIPSEYILKIIGASIGFLFGYITEDLLRKSMAFKALGVCYCRSGGGDTRVYLLLRCISVK